MANLRDVRLRMRAIRQTLQVTKAMNLISTAKLRKGRRILEDTEPFFNRIQKSIFDIVSGASLEKNKFLSTSEIQDPSRVAIMVITSDKGLAGGYNSNVIRQVNQICGRVKNPVLIPIGSIGYRHFIHTPLLILENFSFKSRMPDLDDAKEIADYIVSQYLWDMFDEVYIVYTHMYSSVKLVPRELQLLPLNAKNMQEAFERDGGKRVELQFEYLPSNEEVFDALVPLYVKGIIYGALVEAYVSEQCARMSAMDEASKNADKILADLQIHYNRVRQASITQEMTEIAGGAEALAN
ncbi:MAG: ATP synthase F1 subunit gamma [Treponema sp.]|nr:ATP synthase F1 subunit gamma [Treponema sp.]